MTPMLMLELLEYKTQWTKLYNLQRVYMSIYSSLNKTIETWVSMRPMRPPTIITKTSGDRDQEFFLLSAMQCRDCGTIITLHWHCYPGEPTYLDKYLNQSSRWVFTIFRTKEKKTLYERIPVQFPVLITNLKMTKWCDAV